MIDWIRQMFCDHTWRMSGYGNLVEYGRVWGSYENHVCTKCLKHKQLKFH